MATKSRTAATSGPTTLAASGTSADATGAAPADGTSVEGGGALDTSNGVANATTGASVEVDATGQAVSEVPTADGETAVVADRVLDTPADPKTANGDIVRKEAGIAASATAEQVLVGAGADTIDHSEAIAALSPRVDVPAVPTSPPPPADAMGVSARVLAAVTLGGVRYQPNDVVENLPASLADQQAESLDAHPEAVAYARGQGFPVKQYRPEV